MAIRNNKINTKVTVDTSGATKSTTKFFQDTKKGQQDVAKSSKEASKSISNLGSAANKAGSQGAKGFGGMASAIGGGLKGAIGKVIPMFGALRAAIISTGIGALVVAVGTLVAGIGTAIKKGAEFGKALSTLKGISGATEDELKKLSDQAKALGASTSFTASEVVQLQTELAKLGFSAKEVGEATPSILDLAASLEVGLADAAEFAGSVVRSFGLETNETQRVVDVLAKSATASAQSFESLKESFKLAAPTARALGVSVEETGALLGALANNGLKGSIAGTGLSKVFIQLAKEGKTLDEGLEEVRNSSDKLNTAIDLVGIIGAKSLLTLAESGDDIAYLTAELEAAEGAAAKLAETKLDNLAGDVTKLGSAWEGFILSIEDGSGILNEIARTLVQTVTKVLGFFTATNKLSDSLENQRTTLFQTQGDLMRYEATIASGTATELEYARAQVGRKKAIEELQKQYPGFLENVDAEKVSTEELSGAIQDLNEQLINKILIQKEDEAIQEQAEDTADALKDKLDAEAEALKTAADARKAFSDAGIELEATNPADVFAEAEEKLTELWQQQKITNEEVLKGDASFGSLRGKLKPLANDLVQLKDAEEDYNEEAEKGNTLLENKNALLDQLGIKIEETAKVEDEEAKRKREAEEEAEQKRKEREEAKKKALELLTKRREKDAKEATKLEEQVLRAQQDLEDKTAAEKIERKRQRAQAELDELQINETRKNELRAEIDALYATKQEEAKAAQKVKDDEQAEKDKAIAEQQRQEELANQIALEEIELQRKLDSDKLTYDQRIAAQEAFLQKKMELELDNEALTEQQRLLIQEQAADAKAKVRSDEEQAQKDTQAALVDNALNGAAAAFGIAQEVAVAKMIIAAPEAVAGSFKEAAKAYAPPLSLVMGALGAAGTIAPIVKGLADIKKTRFGKKGKGGGGSTGGSISTAGISGGAGGGGITPDAINDIAANNIARLGVDPSIGNAAGGAAANNVMGGSSNNVVFSESSYGTFQNQVQFKESKTSLGG